MWHHDSPCSDAIRNVTDIPDICACPRHLPWRGFEGPLTTIYGDRKNDLVRVQFMNIGVDTHLLAPSSTTLSPSFSHLSYLLVRSIPRIPMRSRAPASILETPSHLPPTSLSHGNDEAWNGGLWSSCCARSRYFLGTARSSPSSKVDGKGRFRGA